MERRYSKRCEIRGEGDQKKIIGYASVFYREDKPETEFNLYGRVYERIMPGAFDRAIREKQDVVGLFNHNSENLLGRTTNDTVTLSVDDVGLRFEIPFDANDPDHQRAAAKIERGDLAGCSFAFVATSETYRDEKKEDNEIHIREINDVDLFDVGPVTNPAYAGTSVGLRNVNDGFKDVESALDKHLKSRADERRRYADELEIETRMQEIAGAQV